MKNCNVSFKDEENVLNFFNVCVKDIEKQVI